MGGVFRRGEEGVSFYMVLGGVLRRGEEGVSFYMVLGGVLQGEVHLGGGSSPVTKFCFYMYQVCIISSYFYNSKSNI